MSHHHPQQIAQPEQQPRPTLTIFEVIETAPCSGELAVEQRVSFAHIVKYIGTCIGIGILVWLWCAL